MSWVGRDWRFHRLVSRDDSVYVFMLLRKLLPLWREDPDKLAVAITAYELLGYSPAAEEIRDGELPDGSFVEPWSRERAQEAYQGALRGRHRRTLRARAYGLVMGLVELAPAAERDRLHKVRVECHVIECRVLSTEERGERLRADFARDKAREDRAREEATA